MQKVLLALLAVGLMACSHSGDHMHSDGEHTDGDAAMMEETNTDMDAEAPAVEVEVDAEADASDAGEAGMDADDEAAE